MSDHSPGVLAVDLDGTLAKKEHPFNPYSVGEPVQPVLQHLLNEKAKGRSISILTARASSNDPGLRRAVRTWLDRHGLEGVHITSQKTPDMVEIIDDRARQVIPDTGRVVGDHPINDLQDKEAARPDRLRRLWLRRGQCPECGGKPESIHPDVDGDLTCGDCGKDWAQSLAKEAATDLDKVPKPLKRFARPENWDPYDKMQNVVLYCGSNDWEAANTWLWGEGDGKRVWIELKFPSKHPSFERYDDEDEKGWKDWADKAKTTWLAAAKKSKTKSDGLTIESFQIALTDASMKPYISASGTEKMGTKEASAIDPQNPPTTGPAGLMHALQNMDLDALEKQARADIATGKVTKRDRGVKMLNAISGLRRNNTKPADLMITKVPVIPPQFRPFAMLGSTYIPGNANELYQDLFKHLNIHAETVNTLGEEGAAHTRLNTYHAIQALYGYEDPVSLKLQQRDVKGFLHAVVGSGPKFSFVQRKLLSKPLDSVGRGVATANPDLDIDHISIPRDMAWDLLGSIVQRRLVQGGMPLVQAIRNVRTRGREASLALEQEVKERPFILTRAPAWHKFNSVGVYGHLHDGHDIQVNPYISTGMNLDHDGDTLNVIAPILPDSVQEVKDKLLGSKMLFSIRSQDAVVPMVKHEMVLGLSAAASRPSTKVHTFSSRAEAVAAVKSNKVSLKDEVEYPDEPPMPGAAKSLPEVAGVQ
jgi:hypothetical protein